MSSRARQTLECRGNRRVLKTARCCVSSGSSAPSSRTDCRLLYPFDRPIRAQTAAPAYGLSAEALDARVCVRSWRAVAHSASCCRGASARIDVFAVSAGAGAGGGTRLASRLLIADEVGLGKTIQAGLILSELQQRGWCDRAIILAPASLRQQWADELRHRFHIHAAIFDAPPSGTCFPRCPLGLNPWSVEPVSITSIDFVKQPEVLRALTSLTWDLVDHRRSAPGGGGASALCRRRTDRRPGPACGAAHRYSSCGR